MSATTLSSWSSRTIWHSAAATPLITTANIVSAHSNDYPSRAPPSSLTATEPLILATGTTTQVAQIASRQWISPWSSASPAVCRWSSRDSLRNAKSTRQVPPTGPAIGHVPQTRPAAADHDTFTLLGTGPLITPVWNAGRPITLEVKPTPADPMSGTKDLTLSHTLPSSVAIISSTSATVLGETLKLEGRGVTILAENSKSSSSSGTNEDVVKKATVAGSSDTTSIAQGTPSTAQKAVLAFLAAKAAARLEATLAQQTESKDPSKKGAEADEGGKPNKVGKESMSAQGSLPSPAADRDPSASLGQAVLVICPKSLRLAQVSRTILPQSADRDPSKNISSLVVPPLLNISLPTAITSVSEAPLISSTPSSIALPHRSTAAEVVPVVTTPVPIDHVTGLATASQPRPRARILKKSSFGPDRSSDMSENVITAKSQVIVKETPYEQPYDTKSLRYNPPDSRTRYSPPTSRALRDVPSRSRSRSRSPQERRPSYFDRRYRPPQPKIESGVIRLRGLDFRLKHEHSEDAIRTFLEGVPAQHIERIVRLKHPDKGVAFVFCTGLVSVEEMMGIANRFHRKYMKGTDRYIEVEIVPLKDAQIFIEDNAQKCATEGEYGHRDRSRSPMFGGARGNGRGRGGSGGGGRGRGRYERSESPPLPRAPQQQSPTQAHGGYRAHPVQAGAPMNASSWPTVAAWPSVSGGFSLPPSHNWAGANPQPMAVGWPGPASSIPPSTTFEAGQQQQQQYQQYLFWRYQQSLAPPPPPPPQPYAPTPSPQVPRDPRLAGTKPIESNPTALNSTVLAELQAALAALKSNSPTEAS